MKKLVLGSLGSLLTLFTLPIHASTYTISFFNSTGNTLTQKIIPEDSSTHIQCSSNCSSLPPNSNAVYNISSNTSNIPWGTFTATFDYSGDSNYCLSAMEVITIQYDKVANYTATIPSFFINIGEALPSGLYGSVNITKKCAV